MSSSIVIERPDTATVEAEGRAIVATASGIQVTSQAEDAVAKQFLARVSTMAQQVRNLFEAPKKAAHAAHKAICAAEDALLKPCEEARKIVQGRCITYQQAEQRRAEEERRRLEAEARRVEEDRRRAELAALDAQRKAEAERRAEEARKAEAARKAEEERRLAEALAAEQAGEAARASEILAKAEAEAAAARAQEAAREAAGRAEEARLQAEAAAIAAQPIEVAPVRVETQTAEVEGVSSRATWRAEVFDLQALIRYCAEHPEWAHLLQPAMPAINALARSQRDLLRLPGVRSVREESMSVRRTA